MQITTKILFQTEFLAFAMKVFATLHKGGRLGNQKYLRLLADRLKGVADGKIKRLVISMPPRHAKTFMGSICLAAWILAHDPSAKILMLSYGQDLADKIAYAIREILRSGWYRETFTTRLTKNREKLMDFVTTAGGGVRSKSLESAVTGFGANFIIIDDPIEIKDSENVKRLERVKEIFEEEIKTRLDHPKHGSIVIIAHRVSEDDLSGHVLQKHERKKGKGRRRKWRELKLPLVAERDQRYEFADGTIWERKKGELLRPDAFTSQDIEELRAGKHPGFATLQQQNPGADDNLRLKAEHFPSYNPATLPPRLTMTVVLSIDPGQKGGPSNSFHVIQAWTVRDDAYLLLDVWREQTSYGEFRAAVWRFKRRYRPSAILIEDTALGPALRSDLKPQRGMEVVMIAPAENKVQRLRKHRRLLRAGRVRLPDAPWKADFVSEAVLFPYGAYDDQMDALSQFLDWIKKNSNPVPRPPMALGCRAGEQPIVAAPAGSSIGQTNGIALAKRQYFNEPFPQVKVRVIY